MSLTKQVKFIVAIGLQTVIIFAIILFKVSILSSGTDIMLQIEPVDPRDMLRGDYVTFRYSGISSVNSYVSGAQQVKNGSVVYAVLRESGKYWMVQSIQATKPTNGEIVLKGKVVRGGIETQSDVTSNQRLINSRGQHNTLVEITYGIEEYFIPEGTGRGFSFFNKEVVAKVAVDVNGNAVLKQIYVNGKTFEEASLVSIEEVTAESFMGTQNNQRATESDVEAVIQKETAAMASTDLVESAKISDSEQIIHIDSPLGKPVAVNMRVVRALKLTPGSKANTVALRTCSVAGCLPEQSVNVRLGESIIKIDVEFMNTRTVTTDPGANNAYFKSQEARFSVNGTMAPVLELRLGPWENWVESEPSFYIEPMKKHQQTFFIRVPKSIDVVQLVYGKDLSQPVFTIQACFQDSCSSGFVEE